MKTKFKSSCCLCSWSPRVVTALEGLMWSWFITSLWPPTYQLSHWVLCWVEASCCWFCALSRGGNLGDTKPAQSGHTKASSSVGACHLWGNQKEAWHRCPQSAGFTNSFRVCCLPEVLLGSRLLASLPTLTPALSLQPWTKSSPKRPFFSTFA